METAPRATPPAPVPPAAPAAHYEHAEEHPTGARLRALTLAALGVVYGDIGTSPLYTIRETFAAEYGLTPSVPTVYGILSLVLWSLVLVVIVKYLLFILRADNKGEGGVLAMLALLLQRRHRGTDRRWTPILIILGLFGTALLYGDGVITPAISVLGAVEGLQVVAPALEPFVVSITLVILVGLFLFQRFGTARVGKAFGPITLIWFLTIALLGAAEISRAPRVLAAANPWFGVRFFFDHGFVAFTVLGAVFLAVTGAEALYADIGHFGKRPIRLAFLWLVFPALVLNYFGQGALLLRNPDAIANPFYLLAPGWFLYPLLLIATLAAIVASQALISGAFSLAHQCVQLGYSPRLTIVHTSEREYGQIYVPEVNRALMLGTIAIVLYFGSSSALGAAYGIAVTGTMSVTTLLFAVIARTRWHWRRSRVLALAAFFLTFDLAFLGANALKIEHGGWVPLAIALVILTLMTTWKTGRRLLGELMREASLPIDALLADLERRPPLRVPGAAVFLTADLTGAPVVLLHHLKHNKALHERVVLLSVVSADVPAIEDANRVAVTELPLGFYRVKGVFGFMETPNVPQLLELAAQQGLVLQPMQTSYFLSRERILPSGKRRMARWRKKLFVFMARNAQPATQFFGLPPNRVVELGAQVEL